MLVIGFLENVTWKSVNVDETASATFSRECVFVTFQNIVIFIFIHQGAISFIKADSSGGLGMQIWLSLAKLSKLKSQQWI